MHIRYCTVYGSLRVVASSEYIRYATSVKYRRKIRRQRHNRSASNRETALIVLAIVALFIAHLWQEQPVLATLLGILILITLCGFGYAYYLWKARQQQGMRQLSLEAVDTMSGQEFEQYIGALLPALGYSNVRYTARSNDDGIDIIASKDGQKYAIQAKRYSSKVGKESVYPVDSAARSPRYRCDKTMVVTNSYFTKGAKEYAHAVGCQLVDRDELARWRQAVKP